MTDTPLELVERTQQEVEVPGLPEDAVVMITHVNVNSPIPVSGVNPKHLDDFVAQVYAARTAGKGIDISDPLSGILMFHLPAWQLDGILGIGISWPEKTQVQKPELIVASGSQKGYTPPRRR